MSEERNELYEKYFHIWKDVVDALYAVAERHPPKNSSLRNHWRMLSQTPFEELPEEYKEKAFTFMSKIKEFHDK